MVLDGSGGAQISTSLQHTVLASWDDNLHLAQGCVTGRLHVESCPELSANSQIPKKAQGAKVCYS